LEQFLEDHNKVIRENEKILKEKQLNKVRRVANAVTDEEWIKDLLRHGRFGVLATEFNGQPFLNSNNYVYDEDNHCLYFHRNKVGRTSANIQHNPRVCYTVVEMGRMYSGRRVDDFGVEYRSVVIFGRASLVAEEEAERALRMLLEKYAPHLQYGVDYSPFEADCPRKAAVYRIDIEQWSGKKNEVPVDHPQAYQFPRTEG
jgi:hypothetical protein